jgi:selenocysteine lyase/cysteine desulfurase
MGAAHGAKGSARQCMQAAFTLFARHEEALAEKLLGYLRNRSAVRIIGLPGSQGGRRVATISFVVQGRHSEVVVRHVDRAGIGIRFGDFYARRLIESLGLSEQGGVVRVSMAHYNTPDEIDRLIASLDQILPG